jgi:hypothetical protein
MPTERATGTVVDVSIGRAGARRRDTMTTTTRRRVYAAAGAVSLVAGVAVAAPSTAGATTVPTTVAPTATGCTTGTVPAQFQGRPASLKAGLPLGYWIWHDTTGWHVAATHAGKAKVVLTGVIRTSNPMHASGVKLERGLHGDRWVIGPNHRTLTFRFTNYGGADALRIGADCSGTVSFTLYANGHKVSPSRIHLGSGAVAATANPVIMTRTPAV